MSHAFACLIALILAATPGDGPVADEAKEPPLKLTLTIDGKERAIVEGESLKVEGTFTNPTIKLSAGPHREFAYRGVSFLYPRTFHFGADFSNPLVKVWTLTGGDSAIMLVAQPVDLTPRAFADAVVEQSGKENCTLTDCSIVLDGKKREGVAVRARLANQMIVQEVYRVPSGKGMKILILQDKPDEAGKRSAEAEGIRKLLQASLKVVD